MELLKCYKEQISYLFFGVCTTIANIVSYWFCTRVLSLDNIISNVLAWVIAVTLAYITNKFWVFESRTETKKELVQEIFNFFLCRVATLLVDISIMYVCVNILQYSDMIIKVLANVVVVISNYILSKIYIFKNKK